MYRHDHYSRIPKGSGRISSVLCFIVAAFMLVSVLGPVLPVLADETVCFSSDLSEFISKAVITDNEGSDVSESGIVYIGETYTLDLEFSESNVAGSEKQFRYDDDGYLTMQLDTRHLRIDEVNDGILYDADHNPLGEYIIDSGGVLKVKFWFVDKNGDITQEDTGLNLIDSTSNASFWLKADAEVFAGENEEEISVDFGDDVTIILGIDKGGVLSVSKTAGAYDRNTRSVSYSVTVKCDKGQVSALTSSDEAGLILNNVSYGAGGLDLLGMQITDLDGTVVRDGNGDPVTSISGLNALSPSLSAGEGFIITYVMKIDDSIRNFETWDSGRINNTFTASAETGDGPVTKTATASTPFNYSKLGKSGYVTSVTVPGGETRQLIRWSVNVGDYVTDLNGTVLTDLLGEHQTFCTDIAPTYSVPGGGSGTLEWGTDIIIDENDPSVAHITLPFSGKYCEIVYYTEYTRGYTSYTNSISRYGYETRTGTVNTSASGGTTSIDKEHTDIDADYIYYRYTSHIPERYNQKLYIQDYIMVQGYKKAYNYPEDLSVTVTFENGTEKVLVPYGEGEGRSTVWGDYYVLVTYGQSSYTSGGEGSFYITFQYQNAFGQAKSPFDEDVTVTVSYKIPKDALVDDKSGHTLSWILNSGYEISNTAVVFTGDGQRACQDTDSFRSPDSIVKTGAVTDLGTGLIHYRVAVPNVAIVDGQYVPLIPNGQVTDAVFTDAFDGRLEYVDGSITAYVYPRPTGAGNLSDAAYGGGQYYYYYATFGYNGDDPVSGNVLEFALEDFSLISQPRKYNNAYDMNTYDSLDDLLTQHGEDFCTVFEYDMQLREEYLDIAYAQQGLELVNEARYGYKDPQGREYRSDPSEYTVIYTNNVIEKSAGTLQNDDTIDFTILVNSEGRDLTALEKITIDDRMCASLMLYLGTVEVSTGTGSGSDITWSVYEDADIRFDSTENLLQVTVPDDVPVRISYKCRVLGDKDETVSISNTASISGYYNCVDSVEARYAISGSEGGSATFDSNSIYLLKQDAETYASLAGAEFALYGPYNTAKNGVAPEGVAPTVTAHGEELYFYHMFTTEENDSPALNGTFRIDDTYLALTGHYVLKETGAPRGYVISGSVIEFYAGARPEGGNEEIEVLLPEQTLTVQNERVNFVLPATGGKGAQPFVVISSLLILLCVLSYMLRKLSFDL